MSSLSSRNKSYNKKIQVNVNRKLANEAEAIINKMVLTPTTVINAPFKKSG